MFTAKGTTLIRENDGLKYILKVLVHGVDLAEKEGGEFLRNVVTGLLLNFIVGQCNIIEKVLIILIFFEKRENLYILVLYSSS